MTTPDADAKLAAAKQALLERWRRTPAGRGSQIPRLPRSENTLLPLSLAQQRLWFMQSLEKESGFYNIAKAVHLRGPLDAPALIWSLNEIVKRHESLRTAIVDDGGLAMQAIAANVVLSVPLFELRELSPAEREAEVRRLALAEAEAVFDLASAPLMRACLARVADEEHVLYLTIHHIVADGWSFGVLYRELGELYRAYRAGHEPPLPELAIQYADFSVWQRQRLDSGGLDQQLAYWKRRFDGDLPVLELPLDPTPESVGRQRHAGARVTSVLGESELAAMRALSQREGTTLFMMLLTAFQMLLSRLSGHDDIVIGTPIAGRNHLETEALIGFFIGTLALRTDFSGNPSFTEVLQRNAKNVRDAYDNQDLPFEKLVEELHPERRLDRNPIFDVMINYVPERWQIGLQLDDLIATELLMEGRQSKFAMTLYIRHQNRGLLFDLVYRRALFSKERAAAMLEQYVFLLEHICAAPEQAIGCYTLVPAAMRLLLPDAEQALGEPNYPMTTELIAAWAGRAAANTAVTQADKSLSYAELWNAAANLARALRRQGLQGGDVIAIAGQKRFGLVVCMTAVLLAGGVMLTVDPDLPAERQRLLLREARVKRLLYLGALQPEDDWMIASVALTLVDPDSGAMAGAGNAADDDLPQIAPDDPAYIFFTSGTTGVPKGILGCHKGLNHFLAWQRETFAIDSQDRVAHLTALSFDPLLRDVFLPLTSGATLCLPSKNDKLEPASVWSWLASEKISVLHTVPSRAQAWLADALPRLEFPHLRMTFFSGEPLTGSLVDRWRALSASEIINLYGPTETTMTKCFYRVPADVSAGVQPAGQPLPETQALVLNPYGNLCGIGEPGEIVIRTPFRTLGYLNASSETRASFRKNPFRDDDADWLYYTGDSGRYRPDGSLEIGSRLDDQVKINGVRVEPAEVTAVLAQHPAVKACAVIARQNERGENYLAAYLVPAHQNALSVSALRDYVIKRLPIAMLPSAFVMLQALPLTANGKLDRRALPEPEDNRVLRDAFVAPRGPTEQALALIWSELLKRDRVGIHDNFFELGGHSLLATQVISRVKKTFETDIQLRALFESPTVAGLSALILRKQAEALSDDELAQLLTEAQGEGSQVQNLEGRS